MVTIFVVSFSCNVVFNLSSSYFCNQIFSFVRFAFFFSFPCFIRYSSEKLLTSEGRELRRALFSLKQIFQDDKDLVHGFVALGGLNSLVRVGNNADQNYQNYILRALGQVITSNALKRRVVPVKFMKIKTKQPF